MTGTAPAQGAAGKPLTLTEDEIAALYVSAINGEWQTAYSVIALIDMLSVTRLALDTTRAALALAEGRVAAAEAVVAIVESSIERGFVGAGPHMMAALAFWKALITAASGIPDGVGGES